MGAYDERPAGPRGAAESAELCVAEVSVDGAAPMPMVGLLAADGELVIPTDWDDPPLADGHEHVVRIELRPPRIGVGPGRMASMLEGCHAWRLPYGATGGTGTGGRASVHVVGTSMVPGSVHAAAERADGARAERGPGWTGASALLGGFATALLMLRSRGYGERLSGR